MKTYKVKTRNAILEVFVQNEKEDETIMLLNGGPGLSYYLDELAAFLKMEMRVIGFNQRGAGGSISLNNSYTTEEYIVDIMYIADRFNLGKFHLFGHAWGGILGQLYTLRYPEQIKSLFLCNSFTGLGNHWKTMEKEIFNYFSAIIEGKDRLYFELLHSILGVRRFSHLVLKNLVCIMQNYYFRKSGFEFTDKQILKFEVNPGSLLKTRQELVHSQISMPEQMLDVPVLILSGSGDILSENNWRLLERWPSSQKITLNNCGHFPWLESPKQFYNILCQYYAINRGRLD